LGVPVGAFHETDRNHPMAAVAQVLEPLNYRPRALLIGLHGDAEVAGAVCERAALEHVLEYGKRELEAIGLLRVDRHGGAGFRGGDDETLELLGDLRYGSPALGVLVARVQGREL